jgi:thiol-disulfide isomerase/thioredoxin
MSHLVRRTSLLAAAAALAVAAPLAVAGGKSPGKNPPPAPAPAAKAPASYAELLGELARVESEREKAHRKERYEAITAYVKANGSAKDVAAAREALVDLAEEMGDSAMVVQHADAFLAAHGDSDSAVGVKMQRAEALADVGRGDDAKKAYEQLAEVVKDDQRKTWGVLQSRATLLADLGDVAAAKALLDKFKEDVPEAAQAVEQVTSSLDAIGTEPTAFPEGIKDLDGKPVTLGDYAGKVLFIDFWATWCGPCRAEIPHVVSAYERFHDKGFEVLGVTLDGAGDADKVRTFAVANRMPWRQQHDSDPTADGNALAKAYDVQGIPHTILVGRDGKILRMGLRGHALTRSISRALARDAGGAAKPTK